MDSKQSFHAYLESQDFAFLTIRGYSTDLAHFSQWFLQTNGEALSPERITPTDIKAYKQHLLVVERYKANTVNRRLAAISAYIKWAREAGKIFNDPTENVKLVKSVQDAPKWLDKNEQYALQRAIERDLQISKLRYPKRWITRRRDASLALFLLHTGLRLTELTALRLEDVHLSERKGNMLIQNGKGGKQRNVPLNAEARKALQEWLTVRPKNKSPYVWVAVESESQGLSGRAVQRILKRYAEESGLDEITPHVCRHTFAKNLVNQGVGLEKVAMLLGHSSLNTTRLYITPDERDLENAVGKLE
jgi:integrase/recombinase XerC